MGHGKAHAEANDKKKEGPEKEQMGMESGNTLELIPLKGKKKQDINTVCHCPFRNLLARVMKMQLTTPNGAKATIWMKGTNYCHYSRIYRQNQIKGI